MKRRNPLVRGLMKLFNISQVDQVPIDVTDQSYRSLTEKDLKAILNDVYVPDAANRHVVDKLQIPSMLDPISRELMDRRMDNEKLTTIAPEIEQAASILIPSILSPNDFKRNAFTLVIDDPNENDIVKDKIIKLVTDHFDKELEIPIKLSEWINQAIFKVGCKAVMILPTNTIAKLRDEIITVEGLAPVDGLNTFTKNFFNEVESSLEVIDVKKYGKDARNILSDEEIVDRTYATGLFNDYINSVSADKKESEEKKIREFILKGTRRGIEKFSTNSNVKFSADPRIIFSSRFSNAAALESIDSAILSKLGGQPPAPTFRDPKEGITGKNVGKLAAFNYLPYVDLSEYVHDDKISDFPALIELPGESVIPIIIDGSPSNHIGYFVVLNENGSPISIDSDNYEELLSGVSGSQRINNLYSSFYGNSQFSMSKRLATDAKVEILNSIYDSFIKNMMNSKLSKMGLDKHSVNLSSSVSRVMFCRLLKNSETRILFVPRRLMSYMAFQYNSDGTGKSKIENIKFPLSLKMTLIIVRLISLIESSINRRSLNITLDDGIGNPLELLRSVKKDIISNKLYGLSYDPSTIIKSVLDKELTIVPSRIPGVEEFSLSDVPNNVEYPRPDDAVLDEINNMYMLSLGVPPSAMNRLSEDEFSRSVAANNIFFSNQLKSDQRVVTTFVSEMVVNYIRFSKKLTDMIREIISEEAMLKNSSESVTSTEAIVENTDKPIEGTVDVLKGDKDEDGRSIISSEQRLASILANLKFTLPSPNLVHDRSSFEELREYIEMVTTIVEQLFPDEMVLDGELANAIKVLRSTLKRNIIQDHIKTNSLMSDLNFDALSNVDTVGAVSATQKILNLKAALDNVVKVFASQEPEETPKW
jgi:hypothetical protein